MPSSRFLLLGYVRIPLNCLFKEGSQDLQESLRNLRAVASFGLPPFKSAAAVFGISGFSAEKLPPPVPLKVDTELYFRWRVRARKRERERVKE